MHGFFIEAVVACGKFHLEDFGVLDLPVFEGAAVAPGPPEAEHAGFGACVCGNDCMCVCEFVQRWFSGCVCVYMCVYVYVRLYLFVGGCECAALIF